MDTAGLLDTDEVLKPLLEASKEAGESNIATVRAVVMKAFSHPSIFCGFDQIKVAIHPALTSGGGDPSTGESLARTLDLFSYGRYSDYVNNKSSYLNLTETQITKLRQLSVLSAVQDACSRGENEISYNKLAHELGFVSTTNGEQQRQVLQNQQDEETSRLLRQVEQVLISCIYSQVLDGRLCQKEKKLLISSHRGPPCRARDVPLDNLSSMIDKLRGLHERLESSYDELDKAHSSVQTSVNKNTSYWNSVEDRKKKVEASAGDHRSSGGGGGASSSAGVRAMAGWPGGSGGPGGGGAGPAAAGDGMDASRRSSSSRRQSKRSRGGLGGSFTEPFQRY